MKCEWKKRWLTVLLAAAVLVALVLPGALAAEHIFVAVNYNIFPLVDGSMGIVANNTDYIPALLFATISRMNYSHYKEENIFTLVNPDYTIHFDLNKGIAYDLTNKFNVKCVQRNGVIYIPAEFTSNYFGYYFTPIESQYGLIFRVRTAATDDRITFLSASDERLKSLFNDYKDSIRPSPTPTSTPSPRPGVSTPPPPTPTPSPTPTPLAKFAYITIDDGPSAYSDALLDIFDAYGIKGTFFLQGVNLNKNENAVRRMIGDGHAVGLHSYSHSRELFYASPEAMMAELDLTNDILYEIASYKTRLLRLPFGSGGNPDFTEEMQMALREGGFRYWDWNVDPGDALGNTAAQIMDKYRSDLQKIPGNNAYILLHDKKETLENLPRILDDLIEKGYKFRIITDTEFPHNSRNDIGQ